MPDVFQTLAEFSIGLAGFAAIVVAISRRRQSHIYLSRIMITNALVPGMLVLLPPVAAEIGIEGTMIWRVTSGATLVAIVIMSGIVMSRVAAGESHGLNRPLHVGSWIVGYCVFGLNVSNVIGIPWEPNAGLVVLSAWLILVLAAIQFVFILFTLGSEESDLV